MRVGYENSHVTPVRMVDGSWSLRGGSKHVGGTVRLSEVPVQAVPFDLVPRLTCRTPSVWSRRCGWTVPTGLLPPFSHKVGDGITLLSQRVGDEFGPSFSRVTRMSYWAGQYGTGL